MTTPLIGLGLDLTIGDLEPFVLAPQIPEGVVNAQRDIASDLSVWEQGLHCVLVWPTVLTVETLQDILEQLGIDSGGQIRRAITAYLPDFQRDYHLYSGYAVRPRVINFRYFPTDLRVILNGLYRVD